nr:hypothetical protein DVH24_012652 [Ipomoea batatas]
MADSILFAKNILKRRKEIKVVRKRNVIPKLKLRRNYKYVPDGVRKLQYHIGESPNFLELWNKATADVERHEALYPADTCPAYEHRGSASAAVLLRSDGGGGRGRQGADLVLVQFDDGRRDADGGEEALHDVAHTAGGAAEDHHRILRNQAPDFDLRRLGDVDGERRRRGGRRTQL